jgi:hypothetical protein
MEIAKRIPESASGFHIDRDRLGHIYLHITPALPLKGDFMQFRIIIKGVALSTYLREMPVFLKEYITIRRQKRRSSLDFPFGKLYPCLTDKYQQSGIIAEHYFYQDLLIATKIFQNNPVRHVDIGSRIDGFVAHVASFREIEVLDIRALNLSIPNIRFTQADLAKKDISLVEYCDSVSCLHALEHFGLGRYGDPVNYEGHLIGWENIKRMLQKGGKLYISVPIGEQRIEFNAHRVFSIKHLLEMIKGHYRIDSFSYIDDKGNLWQDAALTEDAVRNNCSCHYGCGILELTRL